MNNDNDDNDRREFDILPLNPKVLKDVSRYDDPRIKGLFCRYPRDNQR